jgi:hypothetical protein
VVQLLSGFSYSIPLSGQYWIFLSKSVRCFTGNIQR